MVTTIGGYRLLAPFSQGNAGQSEWTFAEKGGTEYFIKRFLSPRFPTPGAPGSVAENQRRRERADRFEASQRSVMVQLKRVASAGSNLVIPAEFFRVETNYYKVTAKADVSAGIAVHSLDRRGRLSIMTMAAQSLGVLHGIGLVHGDIKPPNVLIDARESNRPRAKIIDFDDCMPAGIPDRAREDVVGDISYYSPEMYDYIAARNDAARITTKSDIFALGLMFVEYDTGKRITFDDDSLRYPCEAAINDLRIRPMQPFQTPGMDALVQQMISKEPSARPDANEVVRRLRAIRSQPAGERPPPPPPPPQGLRGTLVQSTTESMRRAEDGTGEVTTVPGLRGRLAGRGTDAGAARSAGGLILRVGRPSPRSGSEVSTDEWIEAVGAEETPESTGADG